MTASDRDDDRSEDDESEEAQLVSVERAIADARSLLRRARTSVLCTISKKISGWPFGSIAPYALSARGEPILFISTIAEHTRNIEADDRVSLLAQEGSSDGDAQAHARITLLGRAKPIREEDLRDARARYLSRVPSAAAYTNAHDFRFYVVEPEHVRYIGGFGKIFWLDSARLLFDRDTDPLAQSARHVLDHMNHDHAEAVALYCRAFKGVSARTASMVSIDQFGFDVECRSPDLRLRFDFDEPATADTIRERAVEMARRARDLLGESR